MKTGSKMKQDGRIKRGIFIGRFQPFHLGHLHVVNEMERAEDLEELVIGIGSAQMSHTSYNPFTSDEREEMIKQSLSEIKKPYHLIKIDDINNYPKWVNYVESLAPKFDVVYAGNTIVKQLFEEKGYEIRSPVSKNISATEIRQLMLNNGCWQDYVPSGTKKVMQEINGVERLKNSVSKYINPNVTTDIIIDDDKRGIILIKRKHEPFKDYWALPGGHLNSGQESIEMAAVRELKEETSLDLQISDLNLLGVYSNPGRDPRGPTVSIAYYVNKDLSGYNLSAGDDACDLAIFSKIPENIAFDHKKILEDYYRLGKYPAALQRL